MRGVAVHLICSLPSHDRDDGVGCELHDSVIHKAECDIKGIHKKSDADLRQIVASKNRRG